MHPAEVTILVLSSDSLDVRDYWFHAIEECIKGVLVHQPDILADAFHNSTPLHITYTASDSSTIYAHDGVMILPEHTVNQPVVTYTPAPATHYTLVMTDPDAPTRAKPIFGEFIHWAVVNIPGNAVEQGEVVLNYMGAGPPYNGGAHRYLFLLFKQKRILTENEISTLSQKIKTRGCLLSRKILCGLQDSDPPVGFNGFLSEWSPFVDDLHADIGFVPPEEFRSPAQQAKVDAFQLEDKRRQEAEAAAAEAALPMDKKYGVQSESIFLGSTMNKKFASEFLFQKRFVWIDPESKLFHWAKSHETKTSSKSIHLIDDVNKTQNYILH